MTSTKDSLSTSSEFNRFKSVKKLKELAKAPYDLTKPGNLSPERIEQFCAEGCGFKLLYGTERIDEQVMEALFDLAQEAEVFDKMKRMQSGEVINFIRGYPSENRAVLHTATRDFFDDPIQAKPAREAAEMAKVEFEKLEAFMKKVDADGKFKNMIMIGIGGSDLGPYAQYIALEHLKKAGRNLYFVNNIDPDNAAMVLHQAELKSSLVVIVSKSGTTLETTTNDEFLRTRFVEAGLNPAEHFVSVTGEGSPLDDSSKYLESFHIWDWIGGRFSSSSMVGGVLLSFAFGFDVYKEFLRGAHAMDRTALSTDINNNLPLLAALLNIWNHNILGYPTLAMIPYSRALRRYSAHIQQVEMESNGKHIDRNGQEVDFDTGMIIWGEPGTNAQHSFFQLIHQGTEIIPLEFLGFRDSQYGDDVMWEGTTSQEKLLSNMLAQAIALATGQRSDNPNKQFCGNRPSHIILGKQITPFAVGAILAFYEHKVAFEGFIWNINSFDQEGVQLGKVLAKKVISCFARKRGASEETYPLGDAFLSHFNSL
ncbi:MAG: glucose-6-phosphate isomerase [Chlamydiales bacterium]|nr:glucose-6-phosphate isomerase [Chlamydiia bacterium]MCP5507260.1 glucose-6-phosphate isomerase [Chlamydiales bacterium]